MIYHLAHKFAEKGVKVLAVDLDPQAGLTEMFGKALHVDSELCSDWHLSLGHFLINDESRNNNSGKSDELAVYQVNSNLLFIPADIYLYLHDKKLNSIWNASGPIDTLSLFKIYDLTLDLADMNDIEVMLIDLSINCYEISKSTLLTSDCIIVPVSFDDHSTDSLFITGMIMREVKSNPLLEKHKIAFTEEMQKAGYIVFQSDINDITDKPKVERDELIAKNYHEYVLNESRPTVKDIYYDRYSLSIIKFNPSLYQMSREAGKPMFHLTPADGAIGNHLNALRQCSLEYDILAERINEACKLGLKL